MQGIDAIQTKRECKLTSLIHNDTAENGYIVFGYREKSSFRNSDTHDWVESFWQTSSGKSNIESFVELAAEREMRDL